MKQIKSHSTLINEGVEQLVSQIKLSFERDDHANLSGAYTNICDALRTLNGLKIRLEDYKNDLEEELLYNDENEKWYQKC